MNCRRFPGPRWHTDRREKLPQQSGRRSWPSLPGAVAALKQPSKCRLQTVHRLQPIRRRPRLLHARGCRTREPASLRTFRQGGVRFEKIYVAPEAPDQPSRGRSPRHNFCSTPATNSPRPLAQLRHRRKLIDLECGWNAGAKKSLLVRTGYGAELERTTPAKLTKPSSSKICRRPPIGF